MNKSTLLYLSIATIILVILGYILGGAIGGILSLIGYVALFLTWVMGLLMAARAKQWLWFVLVFLFTPITTLIYGLMGRKAA